jgi:PspAB-like protein
VGLWDALRGRTRPKAADLDALFSLPSAAMTLEAALGLHATGTGSVCFRAAEGRASALTQQEAAALVGTGGGPAVESRVDEYGYTWLTVRTDPPDTASLVTDLHAVNSALEVQGFGSGLLCSTVGFRADAGTTVFVVYLYKQGTFYPFCPTGPSSRDSLMERQVRDALDGDLPVEEDTSRWMPIWGIPAD